MGGRGGGYGFGGGSGGGSGLGGDSWEDLRDRLRGKPTTDEQEEETEDWLDDHTEPPTTSEYNPITGKTYDYYEIVIDGITIKYPAPSKSAAEVVRILLGTSLIPSGFKGEFGSISVVPDSSPSDPDAEWAFSGDELTVLHNSKISEGDFAEAAVTHRYYQSWASMCPAQGSDYYNVFHGTEPPMSSKTAGDICKDFVAAARKYVLNRSWLRTYRPRRYSVIDRIARSSSYSG